MFQNKTVEIKKEYILDDDYNYYHVYKSDEGEEVKKAIGNKDVVKLLEKGLEYKCVSNYGLYRLNSHREEMLRNSFIRQK